MQQVFQDSTEMRNPVSIWLMFVQAIRRGWSSTYTVFGGHPWLLTLFLVPWGGFAIQLFTGDREGMSEELKVYVINSLAATGLFFALFFLYNLIAAPYRIERDRRKELQGKLGTEGEQRKQMVQPDWALKDLILHIDPFVFRDQGDGGLEPLRAVEREIADQASIGNLHIWGRKFDHSGMDKLMGISQPLVLIPKERWAEFYFTHHAIFDDRVNHEAQVAPIDHCTGPLFTDLRVSSSQARELWPNVTEIVGAKFEATISVMGVHKVRLNSNKHIDRISQEGTLPQHEITAHFVRPMPRRYSVSVESNGTIFKTIEEETPHLCRLRLQGQNAEKHLAAITFSLLDEEWRSESSSDIEV